jgi:hypothetical protein
MASPGGLTARASASCLHAMMDVIHAALRHDAGKCIFGIRNSGLERYGKAHSIFFKVCLCACLHWYLCLRWAVCVPMHQLRHFPERTNSLLLRFDSVSVSKCLSVCTHVALGCAKRRPIRRRNLCVIAFCQSRWQRSYAWHEFPNDRT